jgi:outer membrane receptor protein involved in Fe transport
VNGIWTWRPTDTQRVTVQAHAQYYALDLFSNFTFFQVDPVNGDGIEQFDRRWVAGFDARYERADRILGVPVTSTAGLQYRVDTPHVILATQVRRDRLAKTQDVDIVEQSYSAFVKLDLAPLPWLRLVTGARGDVFRFQVDDNLGQALDGTVIRGRPGVKANLILGPWLRTELFANFGTGFHSNDARAVVVDPTGVALPEALGYEFGIRTRPHSRVDVSLTYFVLHLESELVLVGDEGVTEARGPSRRHGIELSLRLKLLDWLSFGGDVTWSRARFDNGDAVPLAPRLTARADLTARLPWGLSASVEMRHLGDRDAIEDRSQNAPGYTVFDATARYRWRSLEAFVSVENVFGARYRETQFFFTSRLPGEPAAGVDDFHFIPGNPRAVLGGLAWRF